MYTYIYIISLYIYNYTGDPGSIQKFRLRICVHSGKQLPREKTQVKIEVSQTGQETADVLKGLSNKTKSEYHG